jgi:site-specific recombinase XerD
MGVEPTEGFKGPPTDLKLYNLYLKLINKITVTELAKLTNTSKSYISQVKNGKSSPSSKLIKILFSLKHRGFQKALDPYEAIIHFINSRREGLSGNTGGFYSGYLNKVIPQLGLTPKPEEINNYLRSLQCSQGGKAAYFRVIKVFYRWLYSPKSGFNYHSSMNPITWVEAPKVPKLILPSLSSEQVYYLIQTASTLRDKCIIALFTDSGLRLSELTNIKQQDINWQNRTIKVIGKGNKEGYAPFGERSEYYLREWLKNTELTNGNIWGINKWVIVEMLRELKKKTGLPCNPHTFRRTFACLLRKAGVDTLTIKDLGRWESLEMVQRYTQSISFEDSLKFYKAPLS